MVSTYWPEEEGRFGIITPETFFPGFSKKSEAEKHIQESGWKTAQVVQLSD
jgi:hypothetical protein